MNLSINQQARQPISIKVLAIFLWMLYWVSWQYAAAATATANASASVNISSSIMIGASPKASVVTLSVSTVGQGSIHYAPEASGSNPQGRVYAKGSAVTLTAVPAAGYYFSGWSRDCSGNQADLQLLLDSNKFCIATFTQGTSPSPSQTPNSSASTCTTSPCPPASTLTPIPSQQPSSPPAGNNTAACPGCCPPKLDNDLNLFIPSLPYQPIPGGNGGMNLWLNLKHSQAADGKHSWTLDGYGAQCDDCTAVSVSACGGLVRAGSNAPETHIVNLGKNAGNLVINYETFNVPDQILIEYEGKQLFDSTCIGTKGTKTINMPYQGTSASVTVKVIPNCTGTSDTAWNFTVNCP